MAETERDNKKSNRVRGVSHCQWLEHRSQESEDEWEKAKVSKIAHHIA